MLDLVEKLFSRYGIRSLRYDGSMDRYARETALSTFKRVGGPKVILIRFVMDDKACISYRSSNF
jgi:hypothetical protein